MAYVSLEHGRRREHTQVAHNLDLHVVVYYEW